MKFKVTIEFEKHAMSDGAKQADPSDVAQNLRLRANSYLKGEDSGMGIHWKAAKTKVTIKRIE